jgi:Sulfotransferase family
MRDDFNRTDLTPIFILGMSQRTGTNFLGELLRLHPRCTSPVVWEDFLAAYSDLLVSYAAQVSSNWNPEWGIDRNHGRDLICRHLGEGLISFLQSQRVITPVDPASGPSSTVVSVKEMGKRVVTKTPSVRSLQYFFKIFPQAQLLILVRDGRAVVESAVKSFNRNYEEEMRRWAVSAHTILQFRQSVDHCDRPYMLVRYEDLWMHREQELRRIFSFLDLDVESYDFAAADKVPIRGSSTLVEQGIKVDWVPVENSPSFNPMQRWAHWDRRLHERFNWITGDYLGRFGYEKKIYPGNGSFWKLWNMALDTRYFIRESVRDPKGLARRLLVLFRLSSRSD